MVGLALLVGLPLKNPERLEIGVLSKYLFDNRYTERTDQLILEIGTAEEEPSLREFRRRSGRSEARPLQSRPKEGHFRFVTKTGHSQVSARRTKFGQISTDIGCAAHCQDNNSFGPQISAGAFGQRLDGALVADSFDQHHRSSSVKIGRNDHRWTIRLALRRAPVN